MNLNDKILTIALLFLAGAQLFAQNTNGNIATGTSAARTANGELVLRAFQKSFPGKTGTVAFIDDDWTISAGGETFFWAGGRLLPSAEKDKTDSYSPHFFYVIPDRPASPDS